MARRSDHTREELRNLAICKGKELIETEGFSKFSARKVAKELGYSVGTLYNIFENSNELIMQINVLTMENMKSFILSRIDESKIGGDAIKNLAASYIAFAKENYQLWCALFDFAIPQDYVFPKWYAERINALNDIVEKPLIPFLKNEKEAKEMGDVLWAGVHGICQIGFKGQIDLNQGELVDILVGALIDYYTKNMKS